MGFEGAKMSTNNTKEEPKNPSDFVSKMELESLRKEFDTLKTAYDKLRGDHEKLVSEKETDNKAKLATRLKDLTDLTGDQLEAMTGAEMVDFLEKLDHAKKPTAGIRAGYDEASEKPAIDRTVPNRFAFDKKKE